MKKFKMYLGQAMLIRGYLDNVVIEIENCNHEMNCIQDSNDYQKKADTYKEKVFDLVSDTTMNNLLSQMRKVDKGVYKKHEINFDSYCTKIRASTRDISSNLVSCNDNKGNNLSDVSKIINNIECFEIEKRMSFNIRQEVLYKIKKLERTLNRYYNA